MWIAERKRLPPRGPLPMHAQHFAHPRAQPPRAGEGRAHPSAVLPAPLPAAHTHPHRRGAGGTGGLFHLPRGPPPPLAPATQPSVLWARLGIFFFFPRGGWMAGSVPTTTSSSTAGQGLQLCRHLFNEAADIYFFPPPFSLGKRFTLRAVIKSRPTYIPANPASSTRAALSSYCPPLCLQGWSASDMLNFFILFSGTARVGDEGRGGGSAQSITLKIH